MNRSPLADQIMALVHRYTGGRVGYADGGETNAAAEITRDLAPVTTADILRQMAPPSEVGPDLRRHRQNLAMAGREPTPLQAAAIDEYMTRLPERRELKSREIDEAAVGRAVLGLLHDQVKGAVPPVVPGWNAPEWDPEGYRERLAQLHERTMPEVGYDFLKEGVNTAAQAVPLPAYEKIGSALVSHPKSVGAALATLGGALGFDNYANAQTPADDKRAVMELQRMLQREGLYKGAIDGIMRGETAAAKERYDAIQASKQSRDVAAAKAAADAKVAEAALAEQQRKLKEAEDKRQRELEGNERLKKAEKDLPMFNRALRDFGPAIGTTVGGLLGTATKWGTMRAFNAESKAAAGRANQLIENPQNKDLPQRIADLNQFWSEGQHVPPWQSRTMPFEAAPGKIPPYRSNADAAPSSELYQPRTNRNWARDAGIGGMYGLEYGYSDFKMLPDAEKELAAARVAVKDDPSEANVARLVAAQNQEAFAKTAANFGRTAGIMHLGSAIKFSHKPTRPNISGAEAERIRIDDMLAQKYGAGWNDPNGPKGPIQLQPAPPLQLPAPAAAAAAGPGMPPPAPPAPAGPKNPPTPSPQGTVGLPVASPKSPASASLPDWAGTPPPGIKLPKDHYWDAVQQQPRHASGRFGEMPKFRKAPSKKDKDARPDNGSKSLTESKSAGKLGDEDVPYKPPREPSENDPGFKRNGGQVLDVARRYAQGGVVSHGLMHGPTGGRTDALEVDVPNGAYVIPADVVSALGEGNTMAGSKRFKEISPAPVKGFAAGGTVPIRISDGEEVVHPDVVAGFGKGDLKQGHRVLDALVKQVRAQNIKHLASLPGPAKG